MRLITGYKWQAWSDSDLCSFIQTLLGTCQGRKISKLPCCCQSSGYCRSLVAAVIPPSRHPWTCLSSWKWGSGVSVAGSGPTLSWAAKRQFHQNVKGVGLTSHSRNKLVVELRELAMRNLKLKWQNTTYNSIKNATLGTDVAHYMWDLYWKLNKWRDIPYSMKNLYIRKRDKGTDSVWSLGTGRALGAGHEGGMWWICW